MTTFLAALMMFLLAFSGLALGLIMMRRGLRRGCGGSHEKSCCQENARPDECSQKKQGTKPS